MCGIAGIFGGERSAPELLRAMVGTLVHRGPDGEGFFADAHVALGMRRLAIVDVAGGRQPQSNETGRVWVVFNGEIYNHAELRAELAPRGHAFRTTSDTEVIVHGYEEWGIEGCLERLRGMFAFLLWDSERRELFAARDRLGIKPLYLTRIGSEWRFASEIKALLACPDVPRRVDLEAIGPYLLHQYVPAPATFFAGIEKLLPGHYLRLDHAGRATVRPFWRLAFADDAGEPGARSFAAAAEELRARVVEAVRLCLMSEVPLGCLLSGGLDSAIVTAAMARSTERPVRTFTVGFPELPELDERDHARLVAERYGTAHTELEVSLDATEILERIVYHLDEPLADAAALPTYAICKAAREHVTVLLTGEGSDELFAGYPRYALSRAADALARIPAAARGPALEVLAGLLPHRRAAAALRRLASDQSDALTRNTRWSGVFSPAEVERLCPGVSARVPLPGTAAWPYAADVAPRDGLHRLLYFDLRRWLVDDVLMKVDKMSMAASVEARVPFLDHRLVEYVASLPASYKLRGGRGKALLREAFRDWLPRETARRRKAAFRPPVDVWLRAGLGRLAAERLRAPGSFCRTLLDPRAVEAVLADHATGAADNGQRLWTLLSAELWYGQWFGPRHTVGIPPAALGQCLTKAVRADRPEPARAGRDAALGRTRARPRSVLVVADLPSEGWPSMDRYARALLDHLVAIERGYVVAAAPRNGLGSSRAGGGARRYWNRLVVYPRSLREHRPDAVHVLDHTYAHVLREFPDLPALVTLHDLWPLRRPRHPGSVRERGLDLLVRGIVQGLRAATALCADSAFSAREAAELLGIPGAHVRVVPLGVEDAFFAAPVPAQVETVTCDLFNGGEPRLLHVGSCDPRKNVEGLLRILAEIRRLAPRARLVQLGGRFSAEQSALVARLGLGDAVVQRAGVDEATLRLAYHAAHALLLPSLYEGFGLPVVEAQASGLPVLCSDRGSLPEVAGDGAVVLDPGHAARFAWETLELLEDRLRRDRLVEAGRTNASHYTWRRTAAEVARIHQELLDA